MVNAVKFELVDGFVVCADLIENVKMPEKLVVDGYIYYSSEKPVNETLSEYADYLHFYQVVGFVDFLNGKMSVGDKQRYN